MKQTCLLSAILLVLSSPALALIHFGVHAGLDMNAQDVYTLTEDDLGLESPTELVSLTRSAFSNPLMAGLHIGVDALPVVDFEFGVEGSLATYDVLYEHGDVPPFANSSSETVPFGRISAYGSAKLTVIDLPMLDGYAGAGLGYHLLTPLFSRELLQTEVGDGNYDLDIGEILARQPGIGYHLLAGARFEPALMPVAFNVEGRYMILPANDYGDETNRFLCVSAAVEFGI